MTRWPLLTLLSYKQQSPGWLTAPLCLQYYSRPRFRDQELGPADITAAGCRRKNAVWQKVMQNPITPPCCCFCTLGTSNLQQFVSRWNKNNQFGWRFGNLLHFAENWRASCAQFCFNLSQPSNVLLLWTDWKLTPVSVVVQILWDRIK